MFRKFLSAKLPKVVLIVTVCGVLIFLNPTGAFRPLRNIAEGFLAPFQKTAYLLSTRISEAKDLIFSIGQLKKENERLIKENQKLLAENVKLSDVKKQNEILQEQLKLLPREKYNLEAAYVIGQDPNGPGNWLEIDKGSRRGIQEGMAVIVSGSILVGKIGEVQTDSSQVILLTNPQSIVNAAVTSSDARGVIRGEYGLGIILDMILQTDTIGIGDEVITSGAGENMPRGLFIGTIREVKPSPDRLFQQALLSPAVQFFKLDLVFVIKSAK